MAPFYSGFWQALPIFASTLALVLVAAAGASAESRRERCLQAARDATGWSIDPARYRIVTGTSGDDVFEATPGLDLICGFAGDDRLRRRLVLERGDIVIGGGGDDVIWMAFGGRFYGGRGNDRLKYLEGGLFAGGPGADRMLQQTGGVFRGGLGNDRVGFDWDPSGVEGGVFYGGRGDDQADQVVNAGSVFIGGPGKDTAGVGRQGRFVGGADDDRAPVLLGGTFKAREGDDVGGEQDGGRFLGGPGFDTVEEYFSGVQFSVERCYLSGGGVCP